MKKLFTILILFLVIGCSSKEKSELLTCLEVSLLTEQDKWNIVDDVLFKDDILMYEAPFGGVVLKVQGRYLKLSISEERQLKSIYRKAMKRADEEAVKKVIKKYKCRNY